MILLVTASSRAKECAAEEAAAEREAAEAAARVIECQAARVAAEQQAKAADERGEALKKDLLAVKQRIAGISDVQTFAARIAEQASVLTRWSHGNRRTETTGEEAPKPLAGIDRPLELRRLRPQNARKTHTG